MKRREMLGSAAALATGLGHAARAQTGPIRIGVALSQTGDLADSAAHYFKGFDLWRRQQNAKGGLLGRQVEFVTYDDRSDAATAARLYERLITSDNVDLLASSLGSAATATGSAVAEKHKRVFINGGGAAEKIQQRGFKYVFQTAARTGAYLDAMEPMVRQHGFKTFAYISRDYAASRDIEGTLRGIVDRVGGKLVLVGYFPQGTVDYSSQIAQARQLDPDVWVSLGYPNEAIEMVRQLRAVNYLPRAFICNGVAQEDFLKAAGKDGEEALGFSLYEPSLKSAGNTAFVAAFNQAYNYLPGYYAAFGFAAGTVTGEAVTRTGSLDQDKLRDTLVTLRMDNVLGRYEVDPKTGMQMGVSGLLVQILNGKREVVGPEEFRTATPVIPLHPWSQR